MDSNPTPTLADLSGREADLGPHVLVAANDPDAHERLIEQRGGRRKAERWLRDMLELVVDPEPCEWDDVNYQAECIGRQYALRSIMDSEPLHLRQMLGELWCALVSARQYARMPVGWDDDLTELDNWSVALSQALSAAGFIMVPIEALNVRRG